MNEFFHIVFSPQNMLATFILCFCILYWLIVIVGAIDMDLIDVDIDVDSDFDMDSEVGSSGESGVAWFNKVLLFFNLGKIPFMVWLTIVALPLWTGSMVLSTILGISSFWVSLIYFVPLLIGSMLIAKPLTWPFVKLFAALDKHNAPKELVGKIGTVVLPGTGENRGQIEIAYDGSYIRIYVRPTDKSIQLQKNMQVLVIEKFDDHTYLVEPYTE